MNKKIFTLILLCGCIFAATVRATGIDKNTAKMQAMDKITGRVSVIYIPVGGAVNFGSLSIAVRSCKTRPEEETPDNFVFADIADKTLQGQNVNIFRGWMISSSPATNAVEHPIYDVWLLQCLDKKVDKTLLLTDAQFAERETFLMQRSKDTAANTLKTEENAPAHPMEEMSEEEHTPTILQSSVEFSYDEAEEEIIINENTQEINAKENIEMPTLPEITLEE
ncbi:MAG: DUF2155 domain-containing protein [Alphaproteobacteria bacterium]|nr:DUF2155 domain-containing protein [Alphaproteobacteria bacterium]